MTHRRGHFPITTALLAAFLVLPGGTAQGQEQGGLPAPRGQVAADCYARLELWQGDVRTPVRLLFTRVAYTETASGGVARELSSQWNKFIGARLAGEPARPDFNRIVYCRYADEPANSEIARWPASASPPVEVNWPGRSIAWQAARAAAPVAQPPAALTAPSAAPASPAPAASAIRAAPPLSPAVPASPSATLAPAGRAESGAIDGDIAGLPPPPEGSQYDPAALAAYQQQMEAYRQRLAAEAAAQQARAAALRQQQEAYQRELAAAQAAKRQYEADRAAYEAELAKRR